MTYNEASQEDMVAEVEYARLQRQYEGSYVARRSEVVVASAATYDDLSDQL